MGIVTGVSGSVTVPHGSTGQIDLGGSVNVGEPADVMHITRWLADINRELHDISNFDDGANNARTKIGGQHMLTGNLEGWAAAQEVGVLAGIFDLAPSWSGDADREGIQDLNVRSVASESIWILKINATENYTFFGILSNIQHKIEKSGLISFSFNFESDRNGGAIVATT